MKYLRCKSAVRSICVLDPQTLIVGENEGWFEVVRVSNNLELVEIILSKKFESVGHVFTLQLTQEPYQIVVCSYTGVHFVKMVPDDQSLKLQDISYETEQFVNRVLEYDKEQYLAASWDNNKFIFVDNKKEQIKSILTHP